MLRKSTVRPWPSVNRPSSRTGQQHVEHVRVGLLDLVEQDHRVRPPSHRLGQLTALVVADVAGRRTDEPGHGVLLAVLAHVDADHRALVVEQELRQRLCQLGLADAGRAEEHERAGGPVRVGDAGPGAAHRIGHRLHGLASGRRRACPARPPCAAAWPSRPRACRPAGMPVHAATTSAMSSGPTSSLSMTPSRASATAGAPRRASSRARGCGRSAARRPWPGRRRARPGRPRRAACPAAP